MKKILITLITLITLTGGVFAGEERQPDQEVLAAFEAEFAGAQDAEWQTKKDVYQVNFLYEGERVFAFFNRKAELICITRYILSTELPGYLQKSLRKKYADYWIADLFELSNEEGTWYYITLEDADTKIILEASEQGSWKLFKKTNE